MTSQTAVIYVQRTGFYYKDNTKDSPVLHYGFSPSVVADLDVIDSKALTESIKVFITDNKLVAKECVIVVSESVYFEKDYAGITKEQEQPVTQLFIDSVPFENVLTKTYLIENGIKVVVANKDFCMALKTVFGSNNLFVCAITPAVIAGVKEGDDMAASFSLFFEKYEFIKQNNFLLSVSVQQKKTSFGQNQQKIQTGAPQKQSNKRVIILAVFFLLLVGILVAMLLSNRS